MLGHFLKLLQTAQWMIRHTGHTFSLALVKLYLGLRKAPRKTREPGRVGTLDGPWQIIMQPASLFASLTQGNVNSLPPKRSSGAS